MFEKMQTDLSWYNSPKVESKKETLALRRLREAWIHVLSPSASPASIPRVLQDMKGLHAPSLLKDKDWRHAWTLLALSPESWNAVALVAWRQGLLAGQAIEDASFFDLLPRQWVFQSRKWIIGWERDKVRHFLSQDVETGAGLRRNHSSVHWQACEKYWIEGFGLGFGLWVQASFIEKGHVLEWRVLELGQDSKLW